MSRHTNPQVEIFVSTDGVEKISVPYQCRSCTWIDVLSRSTWAIELLHGTIRHHARSLAKSAVNVKAKR